jgi:hypothetical protein
MEDGRWVSGAAVPVADDPKTAFSALRWPASAALLATALLLWRIGMDGVSSAELLAHAGWCLGLGEEPARGGVATFFGHCAACYAGLAAALAGATVALWPKP